MARYTRTIYEEPTGLKALWLYVLYPMLVVTVFMGAMFALIVGGYAISGGTI